MSLVIIKMGKIDGLCRLNLCKSRRAMAPSPKRDGGHFTGEFGRTVFEEWKKQQRYHKEDAG